MLQLMLMLGMRGGTPGTVRLDQATRRLLDGRNFATVATLNPGGTPQTSVVWVARDGDTVLFSTTAGRRKARNLIRDPRISLMVVDAANPYRSAEIRGVAELYEDPAKTLAVLLSRKYLGQDPPDEGEEVIRLIVRVRPQQINAFGLDPVAPETPAGFPGDGGGAAISGRAS